MKIDSLTGTLELESGLVLSPALSRSQFLASCSAPTRVQNTDPLGNHENGTPEDAKTRQKTPRKQ
ncbi:hypothetical protein [Sorangium sp. So ce426]|uniref:hypothetical protein n=1 Tax=unclassified Sorangium TaxID=2621164 RepID=UPI003F5C969D